LKCILTGSYKKAIFTIKNENNFVSTHSFYIHPGVYQRGSSQNTWTSLSDPIWNEQHQLRRYNIVVGEPIARPFILDNYEWYAFIQVEIGKEWYYVIACPKI